MKQIEDLVVGYEVNKLKVLYCVSVETYTFVRQECLTYQTVEQTFLSVL